jgi:hypothetical protein
LREEVTSLQDRSHYSMIEHMFDSVSEVEVGEPVDPQLEDAFDWVSIERELRRGEEDRTWGNTVPSGVFALEIDSDTRCEAGLTDTQLIDAMVGFERLAGWAEARQARVLAEFARRRPGEDTTLVATDKPCAMSKFAPDEVGLALKLARMTAKARIGRAVQLQQVLPETLRLWQQGRLDERRVAAICDATHYLSAKKARGAAAGPGPGPRPNGRPVEGGAETRRDRRRPGGRRGAAAGRPPRPAGGGRRGAGRDGLAVGADVGPGRPGQLPMADPPRVGLREG